MSILEDTKAGRICRCTEGQIIIPKSKKQQCQQQIKAKIKFTECHWFCTRNSSRAECLNVQKQKESFRLTHFLRYLWPRRGLVGSGKKWPKLELFVSQLHVWLHGFLTMLEAGGRDLVDQSAVSHSQITSGLKRFQHPRGWWEKWRQEMYSFKKVICIIFVACGYNTETHTQKKHMYKSQNKNISQ